jgi:hypothetical protein
MEPNPYLERIIELGMKHSACYVDLVGETSFTKSFEPVYADDICEAAPSTFRIPAEDMESFLRSTLENCRGKTSKPDGWRDSKAEWHGSMVKCRADKVLKISVVIRRQGDVLRILFTLESEAA